MSSSLGRLALGIVGAVIGAAFGVPAIGFAIGSAIGGFVFAPEGPNIEGPRLGDVDVTASSLGKIIPEHYGVTRAGGNVLWSGGLKEIKKVEEVGGGGKGGGGGGGTQTTYEYYASFAVAFGRGPASQLRKIWADGKLIYDATGDSETNNSKYQFRFRRGGDTTPDPLIAESINRRLAGQPDVNAGNGPQADFKTIDELILEVQASGDPRSQLYATYLTQLKNNAEAGGAQIPDYQFTPSYKQLCMLVFVDMPLADFGNRIPNITAEIVWNTDLNINPNDSVVEVPLFESGVDSTVPSSAMGVDATGRTLLTLGTTHLRKFNARQISEVGNALITQSYSFTNRIGYGEDATEITYSGTATVEEILGANSAGDYIVRIDRTGATSSQTIAKVSNASLDILPGVTKSGPSGVGSPANTCTFGCNAGSIAERDLFAACTDAGRFFLFDTNNTNLSVARGNGSTAFTAIGGGPMSYGGGTAGFSRIYWAAQNGVSYVIYSIEITFGSSGTPAVNFTTLDSGSIAGDGQPTTLLVDYASSRLFVLYDTGAGGRIRQFDPLAAGTTGDPFLKYDVLLTFAPPGLKSGLGRSSVSSGICTYGNGQNMIAVDLSTGEETIFAGALSDSISPNAQVFLGSEGANYTWLGANATRVSFGGLSNALFSTDLSGVITSICKRTGMADDEFDVSEIEGLYNVRGYTIARATNGRKAIENLLTAYFVDGIESDWTVYFKTRTNTPVRTITENELGPVRGPTGDIILKQARQPEYDLPSEIAMIYADQDRDYQQGSAHVRRISQPRASMYSNKTQNIEIPLVLVETEAKQIAERLLYQTWMSRDTLQGKLPWTHLDLDPTDVIEVSLNDGTVYTDRLAKMDIGADFSIEFNSTRAADPTFTPADVAQISSSNIPSNNVIVPVFTKLFVIDSPLIEDFHDVARTAVRFYTAVGSDTTNFLSADLYQSPDANTYAAFDSATVDVTWGQVVGNPLGEPRALWTLDEDNSITIRLSVDNGDVNSTTYEDMLNANANRAMIWNSNTGVGEIIQFQNVTDNGDGTLTLDTLIRGRRGTDYAVSTHESGEFFILLTNQAVLPQINPLAVIGSTQYFKAVSRGALIGSAQAVSNTMVARDLHPYAPSNVTRSDDGSDLTIRWNRRTRIGGEWNMFGAGVETLPLNEDLEAYEVYLLPNNNTALEDFDPLDVGTYLERRNVATPEVVFTAADLSSYGISLTDTVFVAVYQLSAQIGRGFPTLVGLAP